MDSTALTVLTIRKVKMFDIEDREMLRHASFVKWHSRRLKQGMRHGC